MSEISYVERAALLAYTVLSVSELSSDKMKFVYDTAVAKLSPEQLEAIQNTAQSLIFGVNSQAEGSYNGDDVGSNYDTMSTDEIKDQDDSANSGEVKPDLDSGAGGAALGGPPPSSMVDSGVKHNIVFSSILSKKSHKKSNGGENMTKGEAKKKLAKELAKEAFMADINSDHELLETVEQGLLEIDFNNKYAALKREALRHDVSGDLEKLAETEEKLTYLERDWNAFKSVNKFPEQEDGVVEMGYAKPDFNMGTDHTVNPSNVMDPDGKIPDMEQFPSGDDVRTKDFKDAKPNVPMAENSNAGSSISKVVDDIEQVKVLDEKKDVHQKPQPAVPDSLPKLADVKKNDLTKLASIAQELMEKEASMEKTAQWQLLIQYLPMILELLPVISEVLPQLQELSQKMPQLQQLLQLAPQLEGVQDALPTLGQAFKGM